MATAWSYDTEYSVYSLHHQVNPQDAPIRTADTKTAKRAGSWIACSAQSPPQGSPIATTQSSLTASLATLAGTDAQSSRTVQAHNKEDPFLTRYTFYLTASTL